MAPWTCQCRGRVIPKHPQFCTAHPRQIYYRISVSGQGRVTNHKCNVKSGLSHRSKNCTLFLEVSGILVTRNLYWGRDASRPCGRLNHLGNPRVEWVSQHLPKQCFHRKELPHSNHHQPHGQTPRLWMRQFPGALKFWGLNVKVSLQ